MYKIIVSIFLIAFMPRLASAQIDHKMLEPKKMKKDFKEFLEFLEAHPDPYTKISEVDFNALVKEAQMAIQESMDEIDFYKHLSKITASIHDGHSEMYMPENWLKDKRKKYGAFPYRAYLDNEDQLYIIEDYGDGKIPLGAKVETINGVAIDSLLSRIDPFISYELKQFRNDQITASFELMLYLVFKDISNIDISYKLSSSEKVTISAIDYDQYKKAIKDQREEREKQIAKGKPYHFEILRPGIAKIDIFSFSVPRPDKFDYFLGETFKKIKKNNIHSLIIDVRGNYGGFPKMASKIFHYIHDGHFKTTAKSVMKISQPYRDIYLDRWPRLRSISLAKRQRRHFVDIEEVVHGELNTFVEEQAFFNESPVVKPNKFAGDCYLLIDRRSFSAASSFAATFQCYGMGLLIGEVTGGSKIFRANAIFKELPKSNLRMKISTTKLYSTCYAEEDQGVEPNVKVGPSMLDRIHKIDSPLNMALLLIKKIQRKKSSGE